MIEQNYVIKNKTGLHARPASLFVQKAASYKSKIKLRKDDKEIDAKSIISVLGLGVCKGEKITIIAEGEDENVAINELVDLLDSFQKLD